jgi:hypothetical protein
MYLGNSAAPLGKRGNSSLVDWVKTSCVVDQELMKILCCFPLGMIVFPFVLGTIHCLYGVWPNLSFLAQVLPMILSHINELIDSS